MGIANSLDNPHYTANCTNHEIMENHILYRVPLEYQPQMKNWIFHYSTRNLNCTIFITNGVLFRNAPNKISKLYACILSMTKSGLRTYWSTSYYRYGVNQLWILTKCNDLRVHTIKAFSCYIINTFDLATLFTPLKYKDR